MTRSITRRALLGSLALGGLALMLPGRAVALTLDEAKGQGLIGERRDGYVGQVAGGADVAALVNQVNAERRAVYQNIATENGLPVSQVEALAAEKQISRAPPGTFVMDAAGRWIRK